MSNFVNLLDIVYPIGSVYITFSNVSPVDSIGGSWEKIDGKFLQSSSETDAVDSTGGSSQNIGFTITFASYNGFHVTCGNDDPNGKLLIIDGNDPGATVYQKSYIQSLGRSKTSQWSHSANKCVASSLTTVQHPYYIYKDVYWNNRPAYITCNMYRRIA